MRIDDLRLQVTLAGVPAGAALAAGGFWIAGPEAGLGVAAGAGLGLGNFWWMTRGVAAVARGVRPVAGWHLLATVRFLVLLIALAGLLRFGLVHPVAVVVGLVVMPAALVAAGLRAAARSEGSG
jgi:hypothetical protein